ncbi:MAG: hypothetical protein OXP75_01085 [Rhodospirillales bacterium]|nr:hypothetical protein [Rhodospirillales bacterium]
MKLLPFRRRSADETPSEYRGYTDVITNALIDASADTAATAYLAALEIAAGHLSRAFASATVSGAGAGGFTVPVMAQIGRALIEAGEAVYVRQGNRLVRGLQYSILPDGRYQAETPFGQIVVPADRAFHATWNLDVMSQRGVAPLTNARTLRDLVRKLEASMGEEAGAAVGYLLPIPSDGDGGNIESLKQDLAALKGRIAVIETTRGGWGEGTTGAPRRDYELVRMGANIPEGNVALYTQATETALAACGVPVQLVQKSDGTAQREAWRRFLHGTVAPMGRIVEAEAARIGLAISLDWDQLFASDIQGRARAFQSLVNGGMSLQAAAAASGILTPSD